MNMKKFLLGTLAGGIAFFFVGYLFYGMALAGFYTEHMASPAAMRMEAIVWWALIVGNLASGALVTYIFLKWAHIASFGGGASGGAIIGFFLALSLNMIQFATAGTLDLTASLVDVLVRTLLYAIAGAVVGAVLGMGNKK
jgi:hypothetical protein